MAENFTINNITFEPHNFTYGDAIQVTMEIKNNSTLRKITSISNFSLRCNYSHTYIDEETNQSINTNYTGYLIDTNLPIIINIPKNTTSTINFNVICSGSRIIPKSSSFINANQLSLMMRDDNIRFIDSNAMILSFSCFFSNDSTATQSLDGQNFSNKFLSNSPNFINGHIIKSFNDVNLTRATFNNNQYSESDEGTYIFIKNLACELNSGYTAADLKNGYCSILVDNNSKSLTSITSYICDTGYQDTNNGIFLSDISSLSTTSEHTVKISLGDSYDQAIFNLTIPIAFANVHLSGTGKGVAFGRFCNANGGSFECDYPAIFYDGAAIPGISNFSLEEQATGGSWIDGKPIYCKSFIGRPKTSGNEVYKTNKEGTFIDDNNNVITNINSAKELSLTYDSIINISGVTKRQYSTGKRFWPIGFCGESTRYASIGVSINDNMPCSLYAYTNRTENAIRSNNADIFFVTIYYTKPSS